MQSGQTWKLGLAHLYCALKSKPFCASYATQEKALPAPSIIPFPCRCVSFPDTVEPVLHGVNPGLSLSLGPVSVQAFLCLEVTTSCFGEFFFLLLPPAPTQTPVLREDLPKQLREQLFLPPEPASSDRVLITFRIVA